MNARELADELGVKRRAVCRLFKVWCEARGLNPHDLFTPGKGYSLPKEFIEYARRYFA